MLSLSPIIRTEKVDWKAISSIISERIGRKLHPAYLRDVYNGHNQSQKVYEEIANVMQEYSSEAKK